MEYSTNKMYGIVIALIFVIVVAVLLWNNLFSGDNKDGCHSHSSSDYTTVSLKSEEERCNEWWWSA